MRKTPCLSCCTVYRDPCVCSAICRRRALFFTDLLACTTSLLAFCITVAKLSYQLPDNHRQQQQQQDAPRQHLTRLIGLLVVPVVLVFFFVMAKRPAAYQQHRTLLCAINRLLRVLVHLHICTSASGRAPLERSLVARLHQLQPGAKPGMLVALVALQPVVFTMQQALFVLPWKGGFATVIVQLVNTGAALNWSHMLPCTLRHPSLQDSIKGPLYAAAEAVCRRMQDAVGAVQLATDVPEGLLMPNGSACSGDAAVQTLNIFATLHALFVVPVAAVSWMDAYFRACSNSSPVSLARDDAGLERNGQPAAAAAPLLRTWGTPATVPGAGSSILTLHGGTQDVLVRHVEAATGTAGCMVHGMCLLLLAPVVLVLTWHVAELMAGALAVAACPAVSH